MDNGTFAPHNCIITGVKLWSGRVFVSVPRWRPGVPGTLNEVVVVQVPTGLLLFLSCFCSFLFFFFYLFVCF